MVVVAAATDAATFVLWCLQLVCACSSILYMRGAFALLLLLFQGYGGGSNALLLMPRKPKEKKSGGPKKQQQELQQRRQQKKPNSTRKQRKLQQLLVGLLYSRFSISTLKPYECCCCSAVGTSAVAAEC